MQALDVGSRAFAFGQSLEKERFQDIWEQSTGILFGYSTKILWHCLKTISNGKLEGLED